MVVERAHDLEAAEHAEDAVVAAAGDLGVEVAADHHRRQRVVAARPAREDVAHAVDGDRATGRLAPSDEQVAHLLVGVVERESSQATGPARPDLGRIHECPPRCCQLNEGRSQLNV